MEGDFSAEPSFVGVFLSVGVSLEGDFGAGPSFSSLLSVEASGAFAASSSSDGLPLLALSSFDSDSVFTALFDLFRFEFTYSGIIETLLGPARSYSWNEKERERLAFCESLIWWLSCIWL